MRKIFLPLTVILFFFICASANAQIGGFCNASVGSIAITSSTGNGCPGNNSTTLTLSGTHVGSLQWLYSLDGVSWMEIDGETGTSYTADDLTVTTRYALRATFTGISGTCSELSNIVVISIAPLVWYKDHDDDHYSDGTSLTQCTNPGADYKLASQLTATTGDCNDNNPSIHPDAPEVFDGVDNNCDGSVDEGFYDYIIPAGISSVSLTVQGAKGGSIKRQTISGGIPQGPLATLAAGGNGAKLNAKFKVETDCQQGLKPGGKLRLIIGATPDAIIRIQQIPTPPGGTLPVSSGQGGGGGTAILYQAPGTTEWMVLAVAGGGGGAFSRADGLNSLNSPGIAAIQQSFDPITTGPNGMGGKGFFITQEVDDGTPRDGGQIVTTNISGGGGGTFGDATQSCGGKKGMDEGGTSTLCSNGKAGGYGFGAGGSGLIRMDDESTPLSEEGGGGGGGGYSGGNGGENATGGFGGGSYISDLAFESSWLASSSAENGSISLETNPIDNSGCCDPISLTTTALSPLQTPGCGTGDIALITFAYSTTSVPLTAQQYSTLNLPIEEGSCDLSSVSYVDVINQQLTVPGNLVVVRTFTLTDANSNTASATQTITVVDNAPPVVLTRNITVQLDAGGTITITPYDVNNDSYDGCGIQTFLLSKYIFTCSDIGQNTVVFTAIDANGNSSTASAIVTVQDNLPPAIATKNITVQLGAGGKVTITPNDVNNGSHDGCGIQTFLLSKSIFTCSDIGQNTVTLTAIDANSNSSTATAIVTVQDNLPPAIATKNITVQLDGGGTITITPYDVNNGSDDDCGIQTFLLSKYLFTCSDIGQNTVTLTAIDANGNSSTATAIVTVQDNLPPAIATKNITVQLNANGTVTITPNNVNNGSHDGCGIQTFLLSKYNFTCSDIGPNTVTLTAIDANGNTATANATVTVVDNLPPTVRTQNVTISLNASGQASVAAGQVNNSSTDNCSIPANGYLLSKISFDCSNVGPNAVTLKVTDASGNTATASATVTVVDNLPPTVRTQNVTIALNASGQASVAAGQVNNNSTDNCSIPANGYLLSKTSFDCSNVGPNAVTLKVTDASGNTATASATVTVVDNLPPTVRTQNVTIYLNASGQASVAAGQVNNSSTDNCSIPANGYLLSKTSFVCSNVGPNAVTLKVTDANGNTATANATVTVVDNLSPIVNTKSATIYLDASGQATLTVAQVNNSSTDNCSIPANGYLLSKTSFVCSDVGPNAVTLKVTDANGNTATANATVTVVDNLSPIVNTKSATIYLDASGQATLTVAQVNNSSTDNCSIPANGYLLSKTSFVCSDVGPNAVTLKVTDANGNTATANATVTVVDNLSPIVNTKSATIYLDASGQATLTVAQVNNSSTDNCSIPVNGYLLSKTSFDCSNIGPNTVTLKVTDANGNTATATATVTALDNIAPIANCKNIIVYLGTNGMVNIAAADINNNSTDNCTNPAVLGLSINRSSFNTDDLGSYCSKAFNIVLTATDGSGNSSSCTASVTVRKRITKLVYNGVVEGQYSDPANLSATLYDITDGEPGVELPNKTVKFTIGTQSVSDIYGGTGGGTNASAIANGTIVLNQDPTPAYTIVTNFDGDAVYCASLSSVGFDIKPEDICAEYNGQLSVAAIVLSKTSNTAKIVMSVGLADDADGNAGDVTRAKVEFNYGSGWITVPVQALNPAKTLGNATFTATVNFSGDATTLSFEYRISEYYQINQECSDNGQSVINVYKPQGEFITGGGYIVPTNGSIGIMAADPGRKANFGFNVKYNQKNTNLQGNINYIFRRKENGVVRLYQVKGNSMTSLTVNMNDATEGGTKTAVFVGKCNVTDVTNPTAPVPVPNTGNSIMQVIVTDASENGTTDKYGITVWNSSNQLFHSSNWESTKTTKLVLRGGNIVVSGTTSSPLTKSATTTTEPSPSGVNKSATAEKSEASVVDDKLKVVVMPNPSSTNFRITVNSNDLKEPVKLFVTDMLGRVIETRMTNAGQTITIGDKYISGTYAVRIMQGRKTKQLTLIKLSD